jgi:hypothetical protein
MALSSLNARLYVKFCILSPFPMTWFILFPTLSWGNWDSQWEDDLPQIPQLAGDRSWVHVRQSTPELIFYSTVRLSLLTSSSFSKEPPWLLPILISQGHFHINLGFLCCLCPVTLPILYYKSWLVRNYVSVVINLKEIFQNVQEPPPTYRWLRHNDRLFIRGKKEAYCWSKN